MNMELLMNDGWTFALTKLGEKPNAEEFHSVALPHDWLIARTLKLMVFEAADNQGIRRSVVSERTLNQRYVDALTESAVRAVMQSAQEMGLLQ